MATSSLTPHSRGVTQQQGRLPVCERRRGRRALAIFAFAILTAVAAHAAQVPRDPTTERGRALFATQCAGCHGASGLGDGVAATFLYPRPRNFTEQPFKLGGSPAEITRTIQRGIPGTAMPAFGGVLDASQIATLVAFVTALAPADNAVKLPIEAFTVPEPIGSVERGATIFKKSCANCHGSEGHGDGPSAKFLTDDSGVPIRPADFSRSAFKGGKDAAAIFTRITVGLPGTPMPGYGEVLPQSDVWDLVAFVKSRAGDEMPPAPAAIVVHRVATLPADPADKSWVEHAPTILALNPLWQRLDWPPSIEVRALHDGKSIAFLVSWPDATEDRAPGRVQDFLDAVAVMIPARGGIVPFVGMGMGENIARCFHWRAVESAGESAPAFRHALRDDNPLDKEPFARPSEYVGNPIAAPRPSGSPGYGVLELVAAGPGTVTPVPPDHVHVSGKGSWRDKRWNVEFVRPFDVPAADVRLAPGEKTHVAFAVWNGSAGDRNGQKSITQWISLEVGK